MLRGAEGLAFLVRCPAYPDYIFPCHSGAVNFPCKALTAILANHLPRKREYLSFIGTGAGLVNRFPPGAFFDHSSLSFSVKYRLMTFLYKVLRLFSLIDFFFLCDRVYPEALLQEQVAHRLFIA